MNEPPPYIPHEPLRSQDLETASIRSAAPSYISEAPTYTSTIPSPPRIGLPPIPPPASTNTNREPSLDAFRITPSWPRTRTIDPAAQHYHRIAQRRASALTIQEQASLLRAALNGDDALARIKKRKEDAERAKCIRTSEDPYLVGEAAAEYNRQQRLRKENGWGVLEKEDKRWDWLLVQMSDWDEREVSWRRFRKEVDNRKRGKLAKKFGLRLL